MKNKTFAASPLRRETHSHPFRQNLPYEMLQMARQEQALEAAAAPKRKGMGDDVSLFLLSFLAFFTAFYTFIF